jgi:hypothetical protein
MRVKKPHASTRKSRRIDYTSTRVMKQRHRDKLKQRREAKNGRYILGRLAKHGSTVVLEGLACDPATRQPKREDFTSDLEAMARWRTRQGLHRFLKVEPVSKCRLINLETLLAA